MPNLKQVIYNSLLSTSTNFHWWILAFFQVMAFSAVGRWSRPNVMLTGVGWWLVLGIIFLQPLTVRLWLEISAWEAKQPAKISVKSFIWACLTSGLITLCGVGVLVLARFFYPSWVFLVTLSSLVAATAVLAVLYVVLTGQSFVKAWVLALDTWHKKISLVLAAALVLLFVHGISYIFVHTLWRSLYAQGEFSAWNHSATIWILLMVLGFAIAYFAAVLNSFLVLLFLNIIRRKKSEEKEKLAVKLPVLEGNI